MPAPLSGPGLGLQFPQNLYPSELANSPYDASSNRQGLAPGESIVLPAGDWYVTTGFYCVIQHLDPVTGVWAFGQGGGLERGMFFVKSDGFNARVANLTGCLASISVVQYGGGWVQSTSSITVTGGNATAVPIIGGQCSFASIVTGQGGAGYGVPPLVFITPPPPAANNANGVGGVQASGFAGIASGTVSGFTFTNPGAGYPSAPKVVVVPSPFDPNLSTGITAGTITFSIVGSGSVCGALVTNNGSAITPGNLTLTMAGAGSNATLAPNVMQCVTAVSTSGTGTGIGGAGGVTSVGGAPSVGTITNSPEFNHTAWIPRQLQAQLTIGGTGSVAAQVGTIIDGGLFMNAPSPILLVGSAAGGPAAGAGSVVGPTIVLTMGSTADWIQIQQAP